MIKIVGLAPAFADVALRKYIASQNLKDLYELHHYCTADNSRRVVFTHDNSSIVREDCSDGGQILTAFDPEGTPLLSVKLYKNFVDKKTGITYITHKVKL